jgi:hypothetical protein
MSDPLAVSYPFDTTGLASSNLISNEQHVVTSYNYRNQYFVVPKSGPFFVDSLIVTANSNGVVRTLIEGVDYFGALPYLSAAKSIGKALYGAISLADLSITGLVSLRYQTLGGPWSFSDSFVLEKVANHFYNPTITSWEQVTALPEQFPVINHEWKVTDMVGETELVAAISGISDALAIQMANQGKMHLEDFSNPHRVTKDQVGLNLVENFPPATLKGAVDGISGTSLITPHTLARVLEKYFSRDEGTHFNDANNVTIENEALLRAAIALELANHEANQNNPHKVAKAQVGLGSVEDLPVVTNAEILTNAPVHKYLTHDRLLAYMAKFGGTGGGTTSTLAITSSTTSTFLNTAINIPGTASNLTPNTSYTLVISTIPAGFIVGGTAPPDIVNVLTTLAAGDLIFSNVITSPTVIGNYTISAKLYLTSNPVVVVAASNILDMVNSAVNPKVFTMTNTGTPVAGGNLTVSGSVTNLSAGTYTCRWFAVFQDGSTTNVSSQVISTGGVSTSISNSTLIFSTVQGVTAVHGEIYTGVVADGITANSLATSQIVNLSTSVTATPTISIASGVGNITAGSVISVFGTGNNYLPNTAYQVFFNFTAVTGVQPTANSLNLTSDSTGKLTYSKDISTVVGTGNFSVNVSVSKTDDINGVTIATSSVISFNVSAGVSPIITLTTSTINTLVGQPVLWSFVAANTIASTSYIVTLYNGTTVVASQPVFSNSSGDINGINFTFTEPTTPGVINLQAILTLGTTVSAVSNSVSVSFTAAPLTPAVTVNTSVATIVAGGSMTLSIDATNLLANTNYSFTIIPVIGGLNQSPIMTTGSSDSSGHVVVSGIAYIVPATPTTIDFNATVSLNNSAVTVTSKKGSVIVTAPPSFLFSVIISAPVTGYDLNAALIAAGWDQLLPVKATVTNNNYIMASSTNAYAFIAYRPSGWPSGSTLTFTNNSTIVGVGGNGGAGDTPGAGGGPATQFNIDTVLNNNGWIAGGGGGGGGGGHGDRYGMLNGMVSGLPVCGGGGGMGGNYLTSAFGQGGLGNPDINGACTHTSPSYDGKTGAYIGDVCDAWSRSTNADGAAAIFTAPTTWTSGIGGNNTSAVSLTYGADAWGGIGGTGGTFGVAGQAGAPGIVGGQPGGPAGFSIVGASHVTVAITGTLLGPMS